MRYDPYAKGLKCKVFDIETTGLYPTRDRIISASFIDPDGTDLRQYFSEGSAAEYLTVSAILSEMEDCDVLITYNGQSFDVPFVLARAKKYGLAEELPPVRQADIYRWLKSYWPLAQSMPILSQKSVERALGLDERRTDMIGGDECIRLYSEYVNLERQEAKDLILLHNGDDVRQLAAITQSLSFLPYDRIAFEKGFMIKLASVSLLGETVHKVITSEMKLTANELELKAKSYPPCPPAAFYDTDAELRCGNSGDIALKLRTGSRGSLRFADLKALGVDEAELRNRQSVKSGYMLLETEDGVDYGACCELVGILLRRLV